MPQRVDNTKSIERVLSKVYEKLWIQIQKEPNFLNGNLAAVKQKYNDRVYTATRKAIEQVHKEGIDYVGKKLKTDTYISDTDVFIIKKETDDAVNRFWGRVQNDVNRTQSQDTATFIGTKPKQDFNTSYYLSAISTGILVSALSSSTVSKTAQIANADSLDIEGEEGQPKPRMMWHTQHDERVCPICSDLDGEEWEFDDADIQRPPDDSHDNCRCYLEVVTD